MPIKKTISMNNSHKTKGAAYQNIVHKQKNDFPPHSGLQNLYLNVNVA